MAALIASPDSVREQCADLCCCDFSDDECDVVEAGHCQGLVASFLPHGGEGREDEVEDSIIECLIGKSQYALICVIWGVILWESARWMT